MLELPLVADFLELTDEQALDGFALKFHASVRTVPPLLAASRDFSRARSATSSALVRARQRQTSRLGDPSIPPC